jgi:hypothetical protein
LIKIKILFEIKISKFLKKEVLDCNKKYHIFLKNSQVLKTDPKHIQMFENEAFKLEKDYKTELTEGHEMKLIVETKDQKKTLKIQYLKLREIYRHQIFLFNRIIKICIKLGDENSLNKYLDYMNIMNLKKSRYILGWYSFYSN